MPCKSKTTAGSGFLKGKHVAIHESPKIEVYIAGFFSGKPIILTKTLQLSFWKKHNRKSRLDAIPEHETTEYQKDVSCELDLQRVCSEG
ncbi:Erythronate-4-phosphate dehydrogenase family protein [Quillaja saponaria]|uniref:Erythronate-4-phosphate dehydrogenase family protein n=1 Tax=Quillaja saponaria TaxID=32244 RepID=A0AAD7M0Z4_QUISA|nr:Erythronate-4-phosphate dehydrogenase family protein [Quillaja saponaria]